MTQLIVNIEDVSLLAELKRAIMLLRGVSSITECPDTANGCIETTLNAMNDAKSGDTIKCRSFEDYFGRRTSEEKS